MEGKNLIGKILPKGSYVRVGSSHFSLAACCYVDISKKECVRLIVY